MKQVTIVCDGSSLSNGRENPRAAAAALLGYKGIWRAFGEYLGAATNQQAEIAAAALGIENLNEPCKITVYSDSRYVVETMKGNFKRKTNHEWWKRLDGAVAKHQITWQWLKGHSGHEVQEAVDKAARTIAGEGKVNAAVLEEASVSVGVFEF
jgi:ribonuclease HI